MIKEKLNPVSPSFCLAKWKQVTLHLQSGQTHSCHHPASHPIPLKELAETPSALHNTHAKMLARKDMLEGRRPEECSYCWKIEDISPDLSSDRHLKSGESWALPHFDEVRTTPWNKHVLPSYLEVSFSNTCNFKCAYCSPHSSSKWLEEIKELGAYPTTYAFNDLVELVAEGRFPIPESKPNPYVEAFWKWWPELYPALEVLRITGGEPLLTRHTFRVLDYVFDNPRPDLELAVNSNLGVPHELIEKFATRVEDITRAGKIKSFTLFTSIDTWGKQAEYIRYGMHFEEFWKNAEYLLEKIPDLQLSIICTYNALSVPNILRLLQGVKDLKKRHGCRKSDGAPRVVIDFPYLRFPQFLSAKILPQEFSMPLEETVSYVRQRVAPGAFLAEELVKLERLLDWVRTPEPETKIDGYRKNFYRFITEYDRRRGLSFETVFPELAPFLRNNAPND